MPFPFPGMNPYLENPELWPEVHHLLISLLAETFNPQLLPKYRVAIEKRVYQMMADDALLVGIPDVTVSRVKETPATSGPVAVAVPPPVPITVNLPIPVEFREGYLEVREVATKEVVTVIEVLSPANKRPGRGRETYLQKREGVLGSDTHLVEIDLLRSGEPMPMAGIDLASDYRVLISRRQRRPLADLYPFNVPNPIPTFPIPLKGTDQEPEINLHPLLNQLYERAGFAVAIDYEADPRSPAL